MARCLVVTVQEQEKEEEDTEEDEDDDDVGESGAEEVRQHSVGPKT